MNEIFSGLPLHVFGSEYPDMSTPLQRQGGCYLTASGQDVTDVVKAYTSLLRRERCKAAGRKGGKTRTAKRAAASRQNGKLGGRPKGTMKLTFEQLMDSVPRQDLRTLLTIKKAALAVLAKKVNDPWLLTLC